MAGIGGADRNDAAIPRIMAVAFKAAMCMHMGMCVHGCCIWCCFGGLSDQMSIWIWSEQILFTWA